MIEKVNENLYGDYLVEQETNGKMSNLSISGKNESKFLSFNNESNNLINFERSSNNFKRSTFRKEKEEVFYSVLSNEEGKNENKRHFSDISLKSKSRKKSVSDLEVNTESCGCMCNLI